MRKPKTHFEQVPLEVVKKLIAGEAEQEETPERSLETKKSRLEKNFVGQDKHNRRGKLQNYD
jgi:hypothetical protein